MLGCWHGYLPEAKNRFAYGPADATATHCLFPFWYRPIRKENEVALQQAEMRMVRWVCGVKLQDTVPSKGLRERLGLDDIISVLQQNRLRWYGHVLQKEDNDWVKKCMEYEVGGARRRGRPKKTWREIVEKDCQACKLTGRMPWIVKDGNSR